MALPPNFLDELRLRTPLPAVVGRRVKLARSGRQWKGCCPFHGEKTPSFYVYDDHFHCYGCGAHGDAISFVMQSQGMGFMEAVEALAAEAGLEVPKPTPEAAAKAERAKTLHDVLEAAVHAFQRRLFLPEGKAGLEYLRRRGLSDETIQKFGLGWSGEGRGALAADLQREGIEPAMLAEAGLTKPAEGRDGYVDYFFNRVMFPIRDRRGHTVSFGGRILGDGQPKYVNGPETAVFSKRRTLYGLDLARASRALVVVEGYMDVIALHQAGITGAVAPLGTALTDEHLYEVWRVDPMPVLCFDGDTAGARAAARTAELALPHLTPAQSLRIVTLPAGEDPDSLIRKGGKAAFAALLEGAKPLSASLFGLMTEGVSLDSVESRAAFRERLISAAGTVKDRNIGSELRRELLDQFYLLRRKVPDWAKRSLAGHIASKSIGLTGIRGAISSEGTAECLRIIFAMLINHPQLLRQHKEHLVARIKIPAVWLPLWNGIDAWEKKADTGLDTKALLAHLSASGLSSLVQLALENSPLPLPTDVKIGAMPKDVETTWWHYVGLVERPHELENDIANAKQALAEEVNEANQSRLIGFCRAKADLVAIDSWPDDV